MVGGSGEISPLPPTIFVMITNQKWQLYPKSMPRGSAPIVPRGSAFRICLFHRQIHGSRRRAGARVRGGIFGVMMRDRSAGLGTGVVTANIIRFV